ncbi:MAG: N-6 DNA methylase, partial [Saprospiraceae bacterium]
DAGQFRTPRHIIDFLVAIVDPKKGDTVLDPACGTAGFLISAFKRIKEKNNDELTPAERKRLIQNFTGYDISPDMVRLSLVNLYLHGFSDPHIYEYDTLSSEERWKDNYDVILANPPFMSPKGGIRPHKKFSISSNRSEVLFVDYIAEHLHPHGRAGIIVPEGVIFQSGTAYKELRKMLVDNYLYAVVSLPAGIFNPYSGVKTSILLMDREVVKKSKEILFVKIDNDGFNLGAQRNAIKGGQLEKSIKIIHDFNADGKHPSADIAHAVKKSVIAKSGDYNLSGERYRTGNIISTKYESVQLGDICRVINGRAYKQEELLDKGKYPVLRVGNFFSNRSWYYSDLELEPDKYCSKGDLLYAWSASFGPKIWDNEKCIYHYHIWKMEPDESRINKMFLYHVLNRETESIKAEGGRGIAMIHITKSGIEQREIPLPPLSIQEEIVAEIEGYQKIIDGAKMVVENYKPKIDIDPGWEIEKLGDISDFKNGLNFSKESKGEKIKILGVGHFKNNMMAPINELEATQVNEAISETFLLRKGDIVFVRSNGNAELVGRSMVIPDVKERISFSGFTIRCRLKKGIEPLYIGYLFKSDLHSKIMKGAGRGANIRNLSQEILNDVEVPVPSVEVQKQIILNLEKEQVLINANKELIEIFEQKIKDRIGKVWGESLERSNIKNKKSKDLELTEL